MRVASSGMGVDELEVRLELDLVGAKMGHRWRIVNGALEQVLEDSEPEAWDTQLALHLFGGGEGPTISTVLVPMLMVLPDGHQIFTFETMIFWSGHPLDRAAIRSSSMEEAQLVHDATVEHIEEETKDKALDVLDRCKAGDLSVFAGMAR